MNIPTNAELNAAGSDSRLRRNSCVRTVPSTPARKMSYRSKNEPMPAISVTKRCVGVSGRRFSRAAMETGGMRRNETRSLDAKCEQHVAWSADETAVAGIHVQHAARDHRAWAIHRAAVGLHAVDGVE